MEVSDSGRTSGPEKPGQFPNAEVSMVVKDFPRVNDSKPWQTEKALELIVITESGMTNGPLNVVQLTKAILPTVTRVSGRVRALALFL